MSEIITNPNNNPNYKQSIRPIDYNLPSSPNIKNDEISLRTQPKLNTPFPQELINKLISEESKNFILIGHLMPDKDCIGSLVATKELLEMLGKNAQIVLEDGLSKGFKSIPNISNAVKQSVAEAKAEFKNSEKEPTLVILDCATLNRATHEIENLKSLENLEKIILDHHITNNGLNDKLSYIGKESSACEIVCGLAERLGIPLSSLSQNALYALHEGIMADTMGLRTDSTTSKTEELENYLKKLCGEDSLSKYKEDFRNNSFIEGLDTIWQHRIKTINDSRRYPGDSVFTTYLTSTDLKNLNIAPIDCTKLPGQFASYRQVKYGIAIFILENHNGYDITIKSNTKCEVSALNLVKKLSERAATKEFGGHENSAGLFIPKTQYISNIKALEDRHILSAYKDAYHEYQKTGKY